MSLRRRKERSALLRAVASVAAIIVILLVAFGAWFVRSNLPKVDGKLAVAGITTPITIRRDSRGIAHINADSETELFFGEGFACAQDRLWQMDLLRRTAEGKLSEVVGPAALSIDRYMRTVGLAAAAAHDAASLKGQARNDVEAYAAGVNAALASRALPIEFRLLGYRPLPWTPQDSIAIVKLMAQRLDDQWDLVELRYLLQRRIGLRAANALMDTHTPWLEHYIQTSQGPDAASRASENPLPALQVADSAGPPFPPDAESGSNNWALAGRLTTTGKPVLSNDTHLGHSVPSTYWLAQLEGAGFDVEGFIIPGIPFIALGHNAKIGFGVTSGDLAVQDIFIERFRSKTSDEYKVNGRWLRAIHRVERIPIKRKPTEVLDVLVTRHGPVVERFGNQAFALAWTVLRGGNEMKLLPQLDRASNWGQFEDALSLGVGPIFNWVYADVDGNIGYHLAGKVPRRMSGDGSLPVEGEDDRYAWHGYLPFGSLPSALNPRRSAPKKETPEAYLLGDGFLATANNQLAPPSTVIGSSPFFDYPYRVNRIYDLIGVGTNNGAKMSPQAVGAIQADIYDFARFLENADIARVLRQSGDPRLRGIAQQLGSWDGNARSDSPIPTFLVTVERELENKLLAPKIGSTLRSRYDDNFQFIVPLSRAEANDPSLASLGITRKTILGAIPSACSRAADELGVSSRGDLGRVTTWGNYNAAVFDHPIGRAWPLTALFNIRAFPQSGDGFSIYAAKPEHGPASRLAVDTANWDNSSMLLTLGESGHFNSPHYQDEVTDFRSVRWVPTPFSDAAVAAATKDTLVLIPAPK